MFQKNSLLVGPLSEAADSIMEFTSNMFATVLVQQSIERLEEAEIEHEKACLNDQENPEAVLSTKLRVDACMASIQIATAFMTIGDGEEFLQ